MDQVIGALSLFGYGSHWGALRPSPPGIERQLARSPDYDAYTTKNRAESRGARGQRCPDLCFLCLAQHRGSDPAAGGRQTP